MFRNLCIIGAHDFICTAFTQRPLCKNVTFKSPEMLAPARIPVAAGKKMANTEKNVWPSRKSGGKFSMNIFAVMKRAREGREMEREKGN